MMDFIMVPTIIGIITLGIYKLFELFARRRERMMLIEKLDAAQLAAFDAAKIRIQGPGSNALYIGSLLFGLGVGLLVGYVITLNADLSRDAAGAAYGGAVLLFGGLGLIASVFAEKWMNAKK